MRRNLLCAVSRAPDGFMYWRRESQTQGVRDGGHAKGGKPHDWQQMREKDVRQTVGGAVNENGMLAAILSEQLAYTGGSRVQHLARLLNAANLLIKFL